MKKQRVILLHSNRAKFTCKNYLCGLIIGLTLSTTGYAQAPVVDDSDNFAIIEDQQVAYQSSASRKYAQEADDAYYGSSKEDDETPLVREEASKSSENMEFNSADKVQNLQKEIQELRGQLEVQAHELKILKEKQLAFYKDLDTRLKGASPQPQANNLPANKTPQIAPSASLNSMPSIVEDPLFAAPQIKVKPDAKPAAKNQKVTLPASNGIAVGSNNPADEQISYMAAYELVKNKQFDRAIASMQNFVVQYPRGGYTANAHYWLGELYMVKHNYPQAIEQFSLVIQNYPSSSKIAASHLKLGYAYAASGRKNEAITRLTQVINNYPDTAAAQLAAVKLDALRIT